MKVFLNYNLKRKHNDDVICSYFDDEDIIFYLDIVACLWLQRKQSRNSVVQCNSKYLSSYLKGICGQACYKGPGDICGGLGDQYGVCGDGLVCSSCNRCIGCSYNSFTCFDDYECLTDDNVWLSVAYWLGLETLIFIT